MSTGLARYQSFVSWMRTEGLDADPARIRFARWFREDLGAEMFEELLDDGADFTAVVCGNDLIALGVYQVIRARGLPLPRGRLGRRLQRHLVQRQPLAAADERAHPALPDRLPCS